MAGGTLYAWAAQSPGARVLLGRGTSWAATLPNGNEVVVRHSRHGGTLAPLTRDLFLLPTRAPRELRVALRLRESGVPTSEVVAYAVYPALAVLARADIATRLLPGLDLPDAWRAARTEEERVVLMQALGTLLGRLRVAGAIHPDLNLKNVFICRDEASTRAYVLDVDRVMFGDTGNQSHTEKNVRRLMQSAGRWNREQGLGLDWTRYTTTIERAANLEHGT